MKVDVCVVSRRAYRLALTAFVVAVCSFLVSLASLLQSDWGGRLLRRAAADETESRVYVWKPGATAPTPQRTLWKD